MTRTAKHAGGRPSKLTPEVAQKVFQALLLGLTLDEAAAFAGVDDSTLSRWKQRGEKDKSGIYAEFCGLVKKAEPQRTANWLAAIEKAIRGEKGHRVIRRHDKAGNVTSEVEEDFMLIPPQWQASAWKLERLYPERWGRQVPMVQNNIQNNAISAQIADVRKMSDEQIQARLAELAAERKKLRGDEGVPTAS